jgi:polyphosphate kinase
MGRNLDRRVEACFPVYDPEAFRQVRHIIALQLQDMAKARWIDAEQQNRYKREAAPPASQETPPAPLEAQRAIYHFLRDELAD